MGYIGRAAAVGQTETVKDSFNGDNSTVAFTMSQSVSLDTDIEVFVGNVQQEPGSGKAYTVSGTTLTFSEAPPTGTGNIYVIHRNSLQGTLLPPQNLGDRNYLIGGNLSLDADSAALNFGADSDITLTHSADTGLVLKNTSTTGNSGIGAVLTLQTGDTDIAQNNVLGQIDFQAPDEGTGTDAILVSASIRARSEGDFSSSSNVTSLDFMTGASETATSKMSLTSGGNLNLLTDSASMNFGADSDVSITHDPDDGLILKSAATGDDNPFLLTLQTGETDIAQNDILGKIQFQAPDEGTGTDAVLVAAGIQAISEGDFSSSSNATTLQFLTGASEAASAKMSLTSGGDVNVLTDGASIFFGADSEIELRHVADDGLILKHVGTGDGKEPSLTFQAGDNDIAQDDVLGSIFFQAPDEGAGTDAILVAAGIEAVSEGDFSASSNATKLSFKTGSSEAATEKMSLSSAGTLEVLKVGSGTAVNLKMDGTTIGGLGVISDRVYLEAEGSHSVVLDASANDFFPGTGTGTDNDNNIDLGHSAARWKSVYVGTDIRIGGTGVANALDDYEEGTFTVQVDDGSGEEMSFFEQPGQYNAGHYTKIGNMVMFNVRLYSNGDSGMTGSDALRISNLPFTAANRAAGRFMITVSEDMGLTNALCTGGFVNDNSTIAYFRKQDTDGTGSYLTVTESATPRVDLTGVYNTA